MSLGTSAAPALSPDEIDTIIVPAEADGFQETSLDEHRWYAVRIHGSVRSQIKYIAGYQVAARSSGYAFRPSEIY